MKSIAKKYKSLKLWKKYSLILPALGVVIGGIAGGLYYFIDNSAKEAGYRIDVKDQTSDESFALGSIDTQLTSVGVVKVPYDAHTKDYSCYVDGSSDGAESYLYDKEGDKINGKDANVYIQDFIHEHLRVPFISCYGPAKFVNEYTELISPKEWVSYVDWFIDNVSYGPEIYDLEDFVLARGFVEDSPGVVTLGARSNPNKEHSAIEFYPDGYFGIAPIYTVFTGFQSNLAFPFADAFGNETFTKAEIEGENGIASILSETARNYGSFTIKDEVTGISEEVPKFNPFLVEKIGKNEEGEDLFTIYIERFTGLFARLQKKYPHLWSTKDVAYTFFVILQIIL